MSCQVCNKPGPTKVGCSSLGPMSLAYCQKCASMYAEPKDMLKSMIEDCGGIDQVAPWVLELTYFEDDQYKFSPELFK